MGTTTETRITSTQAKDAIYKAHSINSSASEIDGVVNRDRQTIVLLGDSLSAGNGGFPTTATVSIGPFAWANAMTGHKFDLIYNAGIGGENSAQILARVDEDVIARNPTHCMFLCGMNDGTTEAGIQNTKNNIVAIYNKLNEAGIYSFILTNTTKTIDNTKAKAALNINAWMQSYFSLKSNVMIIDLNDAWIDKGSGSGFAKTSLYRDDTHPNGYGGYVGGKKLASSLVGYKQKYFVNESAYNDYSVNSSSKQLLTNARMYGAVGSISSALGGTVTGGVANYQLYRASTGMSVVASKDSTSEKQALDITTTQDSYMQITVSSAYIPKAGDKIYLLADIDLVSSNNLETIQTTLYLSDSEFSNTLAPHSSGIKAPIVETSKQNLVFKGDEYTLTADKTNCWVRVFIKCLGAGNCKVIINNISLFKAN